MKKRAYQHQNIQQAINATFSGVTMPPQMQYRVLREVRGETKVKKKLSLGLVLAIVLILATATALAAALLWEQQVVPMKEIEQTEGDYIHWSIGQKQVLICALIDSGHIEENSETARLFDDATDETEKHAIADQLLLTLIGQTDVEWINVDIITYAIMGAPNTWTPEQRVWWQQVTEQFYGKLNPDTLIVPDNNDLSETEAISIAQKALENVYGFQNGVLENAITITYLYTTEQRPDYRRWSVTFQQYVEGSNSVFEWAVHTTVDNAGNVIGDFDMDEPFLEEKAARDFLTMQEGASPIIQAYRTYAESEGSYLVRNWSLEGKAAYSKELRAKVLEIVNSGDVMLLTSSYNSVLTPNQSLIPNQEIIASTKFAYGLPGNGDIQEKEAEALAVNVLEKEYSLDKEVLELYCNVFEYFDVTDPDMPLWKFVFSPESFEKMETVWIYKIEMNARTGEIIRHSACEWQQLFDESAYNLIWY